jgi:CRISPR/Cas system-associated endonuclease Cas3-HD
MRYELQKHLDEVGCVAADFAKQLVPELESTYRHAGKLHDWGKFRHIWQTAMGGDPEMPVAKAMRRIQPEALAGYRHELGSIANNPCGQNN